MEDMIAKNGKKNHPSFLTNKGLKVKTLKETVRVSKKKLESNITDFKNKIRVKYDILYLFVI